MIYTGVVTGIAQLIFSDNANGSIIEVDGKKYGCELLGQQYTDESHTVSYTHLFNTLIAGLITSFINARLLEPITRLSKAMKEVSQGDFEQHLETNSRIAVAYTHLTIYNLLKKKEFRWIQLDGGKYRISKKSFDDWLDNLE